VKSGHKEVSCVLARGCGDPDDESWAAIGAVAVDDHGMPVDTARDGQAPLKGAHVGVGSDRAPVSACTCR
jgi:hypothetical protein